jgi:hypothetical protein
MCYYFTESDIDMIIIEWPDEWRIPTIPREVPGQTIEGGTTQVETQPPQIPLPKRRRTGQRNLTQVDKISEKPRIQ